MTLRQRMRRYLRATLIGLQGIGIVVVVIYFLLAFDILSPPPDSTAYRNVTWNDLLQQQPPKASEEYSGKPSSLSADPWEKFSDEIESAIVDSAKSKPVAVKKDTSEHLALDGADVRLAGYIVPLEDSPEHTVTEFFLVPYVGACIHVPPPPPDQIVYVRYPVGLRIDSIYQAFQVEGKLHLQSLHTGLADTSYMMVADEVTNYEPQTEQK